MSTSGYKAVLKKYDDCSLEVKSYFNSLPSLVDQSQYEVAIAYLFLMTERAQNRTIYGGVVKLHRANTKLAERVVNQQHLTRNGFHLLFKNIFGHDLPSETNAKIKKAEGVRDKVVHGKKVTDSQMRQAIADILEYAEAMNQEIQKSAGFKPFGDMRGYKGRAESLDTRTSRWLLKGLGFEIK